MCETVRGGSLDDAYKTLVAGRDCSGLFVHDRHNAGAGSGSASGSTRFGACIAARDDGVGIGIARR